MSRPLALAVLVSGRGSNLQAIAESCRRREILAEVRIVISNRPACKGLEFDVAVLADVDRHYCRPEDRESTMKLFYVMVARAREQVILLRQSGVDSRIEEILPKDPEVLRRSVLTGRTGN